MRAQPSRTALALVAVSAVGLAACTAILGMDKLSEKAPLTDPDGGATDEGDAGPIACGDDTIRAAPRPSPGGAGDETRYFALNDLQLATSTELGFDLDHVVTRDPATSSCIFPTGATPLVDPTGGQDNAGAALFPTVGIVAPALSAKAVSERLKDGQFGLLLGLGGWNGTPSDDRLTLLVFPTLGIWTENGDGSTTPGGPTNPQRRKIVGEGDPSDRWMRDARFPPGSAGTAASAWLNDGRLVARFDRIVLPIRPDLDLKPLDLVLRDAWITADLVGDAQQPKLRNGIIAGRFDVSEFLAALFVLRTGADYLCHQASFPELARDRVCAYRDIRSSHCDDGKSLPCDALSVSVGFETYHVEQLGPLFEQSAELYTSAGQLDPSQRCLDFDRDAGARCAP